MNVAIDNPTTFSNLSISIDKFNLSSGSIYNIIFKKQTKKSNYIESKDINCIMSEIHDNFTTISSLLSEKNSLSNNINNNLSNKAKNKEKLSNEQMECFKKYNDIILKEENNVSFYSKKIKNKKDLILLENELISNSNNINKIYRKLSNILNLQVNLICSLHKVIFHLRTCLDIL